MSSSLSTDLSVTMTYKDDFRWENSASVEWEPACRRLVLDVMDVVRLQAVVSPSPDLVFAALLTDEEKLEYRDWTSPFCAGCLFHRSQARYSAFSSYGIVLWYRHAKEIRHLA